MSNQTQTRLGNGYTILSQMTVRRLSPEDLEVQGPDEPPSETLESDHRENLREAAMNAADVRRDTLSIGAAVRTASGAVYTGSPVDGNGWGVHAIELAVSKAISDGGDVISDVAVYSEDGQSGVCGRCLQAVVDYRDEDVTVQLIGDEESARGFKLDELYPIPWQR